MTKVDEMAEAIKTVVAELEQPRYTTNPDPTGILRAMDVVTNEAERLEVFVPKKIY